MANFTAKGAHTRFSRALAVVKQPDDFQMRTLRSVSSAIVA